MKQSQPFHRKFVFIFVYSNMPVLEKLNPRDAIIIWLKNKKHRERQKFKEKEQDWFKNSPHYLCEPKITR